ncbi:peptidase C14, caspase domain-containing protein, partial [Armillaria nabsnona]
ATRMWVFLIGINDYPSPSDPLLGCVSDAAEMRQFFLDIGVPESRIHLLLDDTATRNNITRILYGAITSSEIMPGDAMIVYYAGHGSNYHCLTHSTPSKPKCSSRSCPIEAICPIDRDKLGVNGEPIPDISDCELNSIFKEITHTKGNNLTFIADC